MRDAWFYIVGHLGQGDLVLRHGFVELTFALPGCTDERMHGNETGVQIAHSAQLLQSGIVLTRHIIRVPQGDIRKEGLKFCCHLLEAV